MELKQRCCFVLLCKPGKAPKGVTVNLWKALPNKAQSGTFITIHQLWLLSHGRAGGERRKTAPLDARLPALINLSEFSAAV